MKQIKLWCLLLLTLVPITLQGSSLKYELTYETNHPLKDVVTGVVQIREKVFYYTSIGLKYEDTLTGNIYDVPVVIPDGYKLSTIQAYLNDEYLIKLYDSDSYLLMRVGSDLKTVKWSCKVIDEWLPMEGIDSVGNQYYTGYGGDTSEMSRYLYKISSAGKLLWKTYIGSTPSNVTIAATSLSFDNSENPILSVKWGSVNSRIDKYTINKSSGSVTESGGFYLKHSLGTLVEETSAYVVYEEYFSEGFYKYDKATDTEVRIQIPELLKYGYSRWHTIGSSRINVGFNASNGLGGDTLRLFISHYDLNYNFLYSYDYNLTQYGYDYKYYSFSTQVNDEILIYLRPYDYKKVSPTRIKLTKPLPTISIATPNERIGDNTPIEITIASILNGNTDYTLKVFNSNNQSNVYYEGPIKDNLSILTGEGDIYIQATLINGKNTVKSNIIHNNKKNVLEHSADIISTNNGTQKVLVIVDADRIFTNNATNQKLVADIKKKASGIYLISNNVSEVIKPLLE